MNSSLSLIFIVVIAFSLHVYTDLSLKALTECEALKDVLPGGVRDQGKVSWHCSTTGFFQVRQCALMDSALLLIKFARHQEQRAMMRFEHFNTFGSEAAEFVLSVDIDSPGEWVASYAFSDLHPSVCRKHTTNTQQPAF